LGIYKKNNGFTIVELLVVIVVIAILAALVVVTYMGIRQTTQANVIKGDLASAAKQLANFQTKSSDNTYPLTLAASGIKSGEGVTLTYTSTGTSYCLAAAKGEFSYKISSSNTTPDTGDCGAPLPAGYEVAPVASGGSIAFDGHSPIQPSNCPSTGGEWVKVPGNSLYGTTNGFCVQKYPASNVGGVATSKPAGPRWSPAVTQLTAKGFAEAITTGSHLLSESEWMTIATNAAAQVANWDGGAIGSGKLPRGNTTAIYGGAQAKLSNGETVHFDTGASSWYSSYEFTCYTGPNASDCGLAQQYQPAPANAYQTDQFTILTSYGSMPVNSAGRYYGDPRFANPSLNTYINSSRDKGLGFLRSSYSAGSATVHSFIRGQWNNANLSGLFTLYVYTLQSYANAQYGFRAAY